MGVGLRRRVLTLVIYIFCVLIKNIISIRIENMGNILLFSNFHVLDDVDICKRLFCR
jgi:hypothetical protein